MRPLFRPQLVNDPFGDPVLYVDCLFEKRALMFDLGDIRNLPPRKLLRLSHIFVSHAHMDHFIDFDWLLRISLGRDKVMHLFGPEHFLAQVEHKLAAYTWNLVANYASDFTLVATEVLDESCARRAEFHCRTGFRREGEQELALLDGLLLDGGDADDSLFRVWWRENGEDREAFLPLGQLKANILRVVPGEKVSYVTDLAYHPENVRKVAKLARGSDRLFIEACFLQQDAERAAAKSHLTARQAALIAREAGAREVIPMHFSPCYSDREADLRRELAEAFSGEDANG